MRKVLGRKDLLPAVFARVSSVFWEVDVVAWAGELDAVAWAGEIPTLFW
jgi:hypothetical protein